jgi:hypothetical protein
MKSTLHKSRTLSVALIDGMDEEMHFFVGDWIICSTEFNPKIIGMRALGCLLKWEYQKEQKNLSLIYHKLVILCQ